MLHALHIVHADIKPQNICWSDYYKKYVFIDFGLSSIKNSGPGVKTMTNFKVTYLYCSQDMRKLFMLRGTGLVDLYFNDVYELDQIVKSKFSVENMEN